MFVLDSSVLIEVIERHSRTSKILDVLQNSPLITTSICIHEVLTGARSKRQVFRFEQVFSRAQVLNHDQQAARIGAQIEQELDRKGLKLHIIDIMIAAICIVHDAELITLDQSFKRIEGLKVRIIK